MKSLKHTLISLSVISATAILSAGANATSAEETTQWSPLWVRIKTCTGTAEGNSQGGAQFDLVFAPTFRQTSTPRFRKSPLVNTRLFDISLVVNTNGPKLDSSVGAMTSIMIMPGFRSYLGEERGVKLGGYLGVGAGLALRAQSWHTSTANPIFGIRVGADLMLNWRFGIGATLTQNVIHYSVPHYSNSPLPWLPNAFLYSSIENAEYFQAGIGLV